MYDRTKPAFAASALRLGLAWAALTLPGAAAAMEMAPASAQAPQPLQGRSETVTRMADWVIASGDNNGMPFAIIDKVGAKVFVFRNDGKLRGKASALIGYARGDSSTPHVGDREMSAIRLSERTTPAGRFVASFGPASGGRRVLWVDYATAIALHPVVISDPKERRLQRLKSPTARDNHITHGCINVSAAFYNKVVRPTFSGASGIVYILPERKPLEEVFPAFRSAPTIASNVGQPSAAGLASSTGSEAVLGK